MRPHWALSAAGWHGISCKEPDSTGVDEALPISLSFLLLMRIHLPRLCRFVVVWYKP